MELILLWILFAVFSGVIANSKNKNVALWAFIGLLFGPFGLIVAFLPSEAGDSLKASSRATSQCKKCQESIQFNAKICRHCGTNFPYLTEPARSHVELISKYYVKGDSPTVIADALNKSGVRPANKKSSWEPGDIAQIIEGHIS